MVASRLITLYAWLSVSWSNWGEGVEALVAPNHFLGKCLTDEWVASMEQSLGVNSKQRDSQNRLVHPFLHAAVKHPLNLIVDERTASTEAFSSSCMSSGARIYGAGAVVDATSGAVLDKGRTNGTLVLELNGWITHSLTTLVFSIIAQEIHGVPVSMYYDTLTEKMRDRMTSVGAGKCTPTHLNLEVWFQTFPARLNESYMAGDVGYVGRSGLYTTTKFVDDSMQLPQPLFADFWKGYKHNEELIKAVPESSLRNNTAFFPPADKGCKDNSMGCMDQCSKSPACTKREVDDNEECMVVAMMYDFFDPGYLQAVLSNLEIAAYFCFIGYDGVQEFALDAYKNDRPVLFYHYEPDLFHIKNPDIFQRIFLPRSTPEKVLLATGDFQPSNLTKNPVDVDFPTTKLSKYASYMVENADPIHPFISKFSISELHSNSLLRRYRDASVNKTDPDPTFTAACSWIKDNYAEWTKWIDRKPLCEYNAHVHYDLTGCESETTTENYRTITFEWNFPDPDNASVAYDCDGGLRQLPAPIKTSRKCKWIQSDPTKWQSWIHTKPPCDSSFYKYNITACDKAAKRTVNYWWLLPDPQDTGKSFECDGGEELPSDVRVDCDYMPTESPIFLTVLVIDGIIIALLVFAIGFVIYCRDLPIIKRSQWEFLALVVFGGVMMCVAALLYAGRPTHFLCGARPVFVALGFTTIFGALFVKSLRVYRVFMKTSFKKATVSSALMAKIFVLLVIVDVLILGAWFVADYPNPTIQLKPAKEFRGDIDHISCQSGSFIFNALLVFWKTIVLFMGIYSSFLIRNISNDFQESIWMFASSMMVLIGCLVILPLAYLVDMPAGVFYVFLAGCLLLCTSLVMSFMLVPKIHRLHAESSSGSSNMSTQASTVSTRGSIMKKSGSKVGSKYALTARGTTQPKMSAVVAKLQVSKSTQ